MAWLIDLGSLSIKLNLSYHFHFVLSTIWKFYNFFMRFLGFYPHFCFWKPLFLTKIRSYQLINSDLSP